MSSTTLRKLGRLALGILVVPLAAACWSDVNEAQDAADTATAFDSAAVPAQAAPVGPPIDTLAPPIDTGARADSLADTLADTLAAPTSSGTAGGSATRPPTNPPPV